MEYITLNYKLTMECAMSMLFNCKYLISLYDLCPIYLFSVQLTGFVIIYLINMSIE